MVAPGLVGRTRCGKNMRGKEDYYECGEGDALWALEEEVHFGSV